MSRYIPDNEDMEVFERYLDRHGIENDRDIQEAWNDFRNDLEDNRFESGRKW
mgnify:FL=1|jgi:hypothetical protein